MLFNFNVTNYQEYIILHETLKENKSLPHICIKKKKKEKKEGRGVISISKVKNQSLFVKKIKVRRNTLLFYLRH